jgi:hypothetical protein
VHYKFIAFQLLQGFKIPAFGELYKTIRLRDFRVHIKKNPDAMRFRKQVGPKSTPKFSSEFHPIIPLVPPERPKDESKDKTKFITFELRARAGQPAGSTTYKKVMRVFEEGDPQEWMDVLTGVQEIWRQNSVNGPHDRAATITALLKGDSLSAFETAMEDARADPEDPGNPFELTTEHVDAAISSVSNIVFPFRALETQKLWMNRSMKKPADMSSRMTMAAMTKVNNYLPQFPEGTEESKFSDAEMINLFEFALPRAWRKIMDAKGFIPKNETKAKLLDECERIERIYASKREHEDDDDNGKNKKSKFAKSENSNKKSEQKNTGSKDGRNKGTVVYFCSNCGKNTTHATEDCYTLKNRAKREEQAKAGNGKPFSKRTFRKEINTMARKAGKHDGLDIMKAALKRAESKQAKKSSKKTVAKAGKKKTAESESESSDSEGSVHNLEKPIPRKQPRLVQFENSDESEYEYNSEDEELEDSKPTAEEKAFLRSVNRKEKKMAKEAIEIDSDSDESEE